MNRLFLLTEYPSDVLPMYAQGYSVCQFLISQRDARAFIRFLQDYMKHPSWTENVRKHYGYASLADLQENWLAWVAQGSGPIGKFAGNRKTTPRLNVAQASSVQTSPSVQTAAESSPDTRNAIWPRKRASQTVFGSPTSRQPVALNEPARGTALAAISIRSQDSDGGWYQRKKLGSEDADNASRSLNNSKGPAQSSLATHQLQPAGHLNSDPTKSSAITPMVPPSVRNSGRYSVSQPQPQSQMSRSDFSYDSSGYRPTRY